MLTPVEQKHVASLLWFGKNYHIDQRRIRERANQSFSHDHYFHTVPGLMEIETSAYDAGKDILAGAHGEG